MAKIITQFSSDDSPDIAKRNFEEYLGEGSEWFSEVLNDIKTRWIDNGTKITDILIRENVPIYLATIKAHVPYQMKQITASEGGSHQQTRKNWTPSKSNIIEVLEKFYTIPEDERKGRKEGDYSGMSIDFSFSVDGLGIFRVNFSQEINGCSMSIRILSYELPDFEGVGYQPFYVSWIKNMVNRIQINVPSFRREKEGEPVVMETVPVGNVGSGGLILHVGPTGSGKTTAIAAEMNYFAESTTGGIITYENPIEYRYIATRAPVRQYEIGKDIKKDADRTEFQNIVRHLLRNNPAIVMVGEARTYEEMKTVLDIASRGHLVFATIHASNVLEAISTLFVAVGEDKHLLANSLKAVVAHKLVNNSNGKIYGLHEVLILDKTVRTYLSKDTLKESIEGLRNLMYKESQEGMKNLKQTFSEALNKLYSEEKVDLASKKQIIESSYGIFEQ